MKQARILFSMLHPGYVRNFESTIRLLAERGHFVHVAFVQRDKQAEDRVIERIAAEFPTVTFGTAAKRGKGDVWRGFLWTVRALADAARYRHPRFAETPLLRARVEGKIRKQCSDRTSPALAAVTTRTLDALGRVTSGRGADRVTKLLLALEDVVPESDRFLSSISSFDADVVLVTPLVNMASTQTDYLRAARRLGVPVAVCVASWDNLTNKGLLRGRPHRVFVWNEIQRREAIEMHYIPPERVIATGAPRFDEWFARRPSTTAEAFAEQVGLDPDRPFLAYLCSSPFIAPDEISFVRRWLTALRAADDPLVREVGVLVRPHPQNAAGWATVDLSEFGNAVVHPPAGAQPVSEESRAVFYDTVVHSAAVVGINTSALIESAIVGKNVLTVRAPEFAGTQQGTLHYHYLRFETGGFLHEAETLGAHLDQLRATLESGTSGGALEQTRAFVGEFLRPSGLDVESTPLLATEIERLASERVPRETPRRLILVVRAPLGLMAWMSFASRSRRARRVVLRFARHPAIRPFARKAAMHPRLRGLAHRIAGSAVTPGISVEQGAARAAIAHATEVARSTHGTLLVGPWNGDRASEALVWVPFLRRLGAEAELTPEQLVAIAPTGRAGLYGGVCSRVVDAGDGSEHAHIAGDVVAQALDGWELTTLPMRTLLERTAFARLPKPHDPVTEEMLPDDFVVVRVAFGPAFRDNEENRNVLRRIGASLAESNRVVVLGSQLDSLPEPLTDGGFDAAPGAELTALARARMIVTPLDEDAFTGLVFGVPTVALYSDPAAAADARVDIAERVSSALDTRFVLVASDALPMLSVIAASAAPRLLR